MGRLATAKLFYGIPLHEEGEKPWDENDGDTEAEDVFMEKVMGLEPFEFDELYTWVRDPKTYSYERVWNDPSKAEENEAKLNAYYEKKHKLREECPIDIGYNGHGDGYEVAFLYIKASKVTAEFSEFVALDAVETLVTQPKWIEILRQACEALNMEYEQPNWYLTAHYG